VFQDYELDNRSDIFLQKYVRVACTISNTAVAAHNSE